MQARAHPLRAAAMQEQRVGGDQEYLEEHEQVEQVAGQEGAVDTEQLELEQRVEMLAQAVVATQRVDQRGAAEHRGGQQHQGGETIEHEHDAERRGPVAQGIDAQVAAGGRTYQQQAQGDQCQRREQRQAALPALGQRQQQQAAGKQGEQDRQDQPMAHGRGSSSSGRPSTWSLPRSPRPRRARTTTKAVMAKPMTMAVSTSACGNGSPYSRECRSPRRCRRVGPWRTGTG